MVSTSLESGVNGTAWADPWRYELALAGDRLFDLPFWERVVEEVAADRVLELACGTGRLSLPLAAKLAARGGTSYIGIDTSEAFLAHAERELEQQPSAVRALLEFRHGDMRTPSVAGSFDLVFLPFNSFTYLHTIEDQLSMLRSARSLLAPEGRFAFVVFAPPLEFVAEALGPCPPARLELDLVNPAPGVRRLVRTCFDRYDFATQTVHQTICEELILEDGRTDRSWTELDVHMLFPAELELLLAAAQLEPVQRHGDLNGTPWSSSSNHYAFVCRAA